MKMRLKLFWQERGKQEKLFLMILAAALVLAAYVGLVVAATRARTDLATSLLSLRSQAARMERDAGEILSLRQRPVAKSSVVDLRILAQTQAGAAGLTRSLQRAEAPSSNQVQTVFAAAAFADWLIWLRGMQAQQIRLESCRLEALSSAPGLVSVTASLSRTATP